MKKIFLTLSFLTLSLISFCQLSLIETDSLKVGSSVSAYKYRFYYSQNKYLMFGNDYQSEDEFTMLKLNLIKVKEIEGFKFEVYQSYQGDYVYISKAANRVMILSDDKSFVFY